MEQHQVANGIIKPTVGIFNKGVMTDMGRPDTGRRGVVVGSIWSALACVGGFGTCSLA